MRNEVNTWTTAIATPYDYEKHPRKLRIGFFPDDASTAGIAPCAWESCRVYVKSSTSCYNRSPRYNIL